MEGYPTQIRDPSYPADPQASISIAGKFYVIKVNYPILSVTLKRFFIIKKDNFAYELDTDTLMVKTKVNVLSILISIASFISPTINMKIDVRYLLYLLNI
jgi:hypothetical protein